LSLAGLRLNLAEVDPFTRRRLRVGQQGGKRLTLGMLKLHPNRITRWNGYVRHDCRGRELTALIAEARDEGGNDVCGRWVFVIAWGPSGDHPGLAASIDHGRVRKELPLLGELLLRKSQSYPQQSVQLLLRLS